MIQNWDNVYIFYRGFKYVVNIINTLPIKIISYFKLFDILVFE